MEVIVTNVSKLAYNLFGCFQKYWYPKMDGLQWKTLLDWMIWGVPHPFRGRIQPTFTGRL